MFAAFLLMYVVRLIEFGVWDFFGELYCVDTSTCLFRKIAYKAPHSVCLPQHGTISFSGATPIYTAANLVQI